MSFNSPGGGGGGFLEKTFGESPLSQEKVYFTFLGFCYNKELGFSIRI